jgi:hypothetical protein
MKTYEAGVTLLNITPDVWATGIFFLEVKSQNGEAQRYKLSNIK